MLEDETLVGERPHVDEAFIEASLLEATGVAPPQPRRVRLIVHGAWKPPDRLVLSSYIEPMEWARPTKDALAPDQETAQAFINYWRPFNQRDSFIVHMRDLYTHNFCLSAVARGEK